MNRELTQQLDLAVGTRYRVECYDRSGSLKWSDHFYNRVVTAGLDKLLDATFKTGLTTPA